MPRKMCRQEAVKYYDPAEEKHVKTSQYSCYKLIGTVDDSGRGQITCKLLPDKLPPDMDEQVIAQLPRKMVYPQLDADGVTDLVNAVMDQSFEGLEIIVSRFPTWDIGVEPYMDFLRRHQSVAHSKVDSRHFKRPLSRKIDHRDRIQSLPFHAVMLDFNLLHFGDGDAWGEFILRKDDTMLSRALYDLRDGRTLLTHHYPGRYDALKLNPVPYLAIFNKRRFAGRKLEPGKSLKYYSRNPLR